MDSDIGQGVSKPTAYGERLADLVGAFGGPVPLSMATYNATCLAQAHLQQATEEGDIIGPLLKGVVKQREGSLDAGCIATVMFVLLEGTCRSQTSSDTFPTNSDTLLGVQTFLSLKSRTRQGAIGACGGVRPRKGTGIKAHGASVGR